MDDEIKEEEMGMACGTHGAEEKFTHISVGKTKGNKSLGRQKKCR